MGLKNTPICSVPKVLFFGAIQKSDSERRFHLCDVMTREVNDFLCFEGVFGAQLNHLIEKAVIIVLERYYEVSSLESHRIDPLLLQGKVIVSTRSFGMNLRLFLHLHSFHLLFRCDRRCN